MLADGPSHTTWSLAAHSRREQRAWIDGFTQLLGEAAIQGAVPTDASQDGALSTLSVSKPAETVACA